MEIRIANTADKSAIVALLKASLGETSSPKTAGYWDWKHINNPFGSSPVLLATEGEEIIGARAFMRWQWQRGDKQFSALRAVDTATHPDHQGKGIFKKLTLQLVDQCTAEGDHFVFNTPNDQSRPGYLKMNWVQAAKIPVAIRVSPWGWLPFTAKPLEASAWQSAKASSLCRIWNERLMASGKYFTPKSSQYLYWRYVINPVLTYDWFCEDEFFMACYVKQRGRMKELRVSELLLDYSDKDARRLAEKAVNKMARRYRANIISFSEDAAAVLGNWMTKIGAFGPLLTLRKLAVADDEWNNLQQMDSWHFIMGDMELF